jgi:GAF domain-containing protein
MANKEKLFEKILSDAKDIVQGSRDRDVKLHLICKLLQERQLVLGPYVGEPTDHTRIAFGQGICGQAAEREETFVIQDVSREDNYLSCSIAVKATLWAS